MEPRTSGSNTSAGSSARRKGRSPTAEVIHATAVGAIAGGLLGAAIVKSKGPAIRISKAARRVKDWVKSAAANPTVKSLVRDAAQRVVDYQPSKDATGRRHAVSVRRKG
jgi:hypothetical protein